MRAKMAQQGEYINTVCMILMASQLCCLDPICHSIYNHHDTSRVYLSFAAKKKTTMSYVHTFCIYRNSRCSYSNNIYVGCTQCQGIFGELLRSIKFVQCVGGTGLRQSYACKYN